MKELDRAVEMCTARKFAEALPLLEELAGNEPKDENVLYNLGMCYSELGKLDESIRTLQYCVKIQPAFSNAYVALGYAFGEKGDLQSAIDNLQIALTIDPENKYAYRNLGGMYMKLDEQEKAIECFEKGHAIDPEDPSLTWNLAFAYKLAGRFDDVEPLLRKLVEGGSRPYSEFARGLKREIAHILFKSKGLRMDAVSYCLAALKLFDSRKKQDVRDITFEIAMLGTKGFDTANPDHKYTLKSLPGEFTGLQLVCYMFVGFKFIAKTQDIRFDLSEEYAMALDMWELEKTNGFKP